MLLFSSRYRRKNPSVLRKIVKDARILFFTVSITPIREDNKTLAAFLIWEWNGGWLVGWWVGSFVRSFACVRTRESFIFRVNATDALISAFDNISFFSICCVRH